MPAPRPQPSLPPLIVIAGATATGKTRLAIELARSLPGAEIVSADSRQVYIGMDIGTAKATSVEQAAVVHHGIDLVEPDVRFTVADYQRAALAALAGIAARDGIGLLVGGTGLYLRAVARRLVLDEGGSDPATRTELDARLEHDGLAPLVDELRERDAEGAAVVDLRNPRRVVRALERARLTGSALPPPPRGYPAPVAWLGLALDPARHRERIAARAEAQFAAGLLEEAERLRGCYPEDLPAFSAMGYREAFDVLGGRSDPLEAMARVTARTRAYARRQRTWFRSEPDIRWLEAGEGAAAGARSLLAPFLGRIEPAVYAGGR